MPYEPTDVHRGAWKRGYVVRHARPQQWVRSRTSPIPGSNLPRATTHRQAAANYGMGRSGGHLTIAVETTF
jgi:hypothetical protein